MNVTKRPFRLSDVMVGFTLNLACLMPLCAQDPEDSDAPGRVDVTATLNELNEIKLQMESVAARLDSADTSAQTQTAQQAILDRLDAIIESQQDQQLRESSGEETQPQTGEADTGTSGTLPDQSGRGGPGNAVDSDREPPVDRSTLVRRAWGHLPARVRRQMQSALSEQFLPKYEKLIEDYYKRLADQK